MGNTILLADKSITIQKIVELTFSDENYIIKCVNDGQSALDAIAGVQPSIILADINLPVKSGYEVCQAIRTDPAYSVFSGVPVILLAGIYETMDEDRARQVEIKVREVGANDLLSKPFDPQMLTAKVKELIEGGSPASTTEIPTPSATGFEEPQEERGIFSEVPASSIPSFEAPSDLPAPPPDDSEKTMMLPSPMSYTGNIFAENPPSEETVEPEEERTVQVESVTPMNEPVFEMRGMESAPEPEVAEEPEQQEEQEEPEVQAGGPFEGREEVEFSFDTQPGVAVTPPVPAQDESPFQDVEATPVPAPPATSGFVPAADDPFGDVFAEPPPQPWAAGSASEEDNPFGLPEPPPPPPPAPPAPVQPPVEMAEPKSIPIEASWAQTPIVSGTEIPSAPEESADTDDSDSQRVLEEIMAVPELKPDFGEDTWSRAKKVTEGPVEELFESEPAHSDEKEIAQPDLTEESAPEQMASQTSPQEVAQPPVTSGGAVEITDELVDRIAARVVAKLSERIVSEIVWQVVPDLAEKMIRRELEKLNAGDE